MKTSLLFWVFLTLYSLTVSYSQSRVLYEFGKPSTDELAMKFYEKDSTAAMVVLHDQGVFEYRLIKDQLKLVKTIYKKIKVFDIENFDRMIDNIPLLTSNEDSEQLTGFQGFIHNNTLRKPLTEQELLPSYEEGIGKSVRLLVPHIENGSIIEYSYTILSPFLFNLQGWNFQDEIPKLYSELIFKNPVGINFNNSIYGKEELYLHIADWRKDCLQTMANTNIFRCPIYLYAMKDVPAFRTEEHMLSPKNYLARIEFEPKSVISSKSFKNFHHFSTNWKDIDKQFKNNELFGKRFGNKRYFKQQIPNSILSIEEDVLRAKAVFSFIQDHFEWNGILYNYGATIKDIFKDKIGSAAEINISLINALQAAKLNANLMMISTRENGLPSTLHPVMSKFNYAIAYLEIADKIFLLDATDKETPFGILPFYALNVTGRVMDFKKESFWAPITPHKQNVHYAKSFVKVQPEGNFKGKVKSTSSGYVALSKRKTIKAIGEDAYRQEMEYTQDHREIHDYQIYEIENIDNPIEVNYSIEVNPEKIDNNYLIYPFFNHLYFEENPFTLEDRSYPIDFGFPFLNTYFVTIDLGNIFTIDKIPPNRIIRLPGDDGFCSITYTVEDSKINVHFNFRLNEFRFQPEANTSLKEFFEFAVDVLKNEHIVLKKQML